MAGYGNRYNILGHVYKITILNDFMKKQFILAASLLSTIVYGQVGINTASPVATMDIVGKPTVTSSMDGIIAPRIEGAQLRAKAYTSAQTGALVYVTLADTSPAEQTIDVTSVGYYYFNGTKWVSIGSGSGTFAEVDGVIGNEVLNATINGGLIRAGSGTNVSPYTLGLTSGTSTGQLMTWNGTAWTPSAAVNIYSTNNSFAANRTATIPSGQWLNFAGAGYVGIGGVDSLAKLNVNGFIQFGPTDSDYGVGKVFNDTTGEKYGLTQSAYFPGTGDANSPGTRIYTSGANTKGHISFGNYTGPTAYAEWGRFANKTGNFGINTINGTGSNNPTEKLDINGNVRFRTLPLNGTANAIYTTSTGTVSATQNQTFTATRTVVADANGVLGYVNTIPSDAGTTKVIVNVSVPGTQNLMNAFSPPVTAQFTDESIDTYNAWTNNVFTVPTNLNGLYSVVMQNSSTHTSTGTATPTWSTIAFYEKSTDGGANWSELMRHTYSNLAGTIVDNGNTLYWTGFLNVGDQLRVRLNCNSTTNNMVNRGGLSITKIAQ